MQSILRLPALHFYFWPVYPPLVHFCSFPSTQSLPFSSLFLPSFYHFFLYIMTDLYQRIKLNSYAGVSTMANRDIPPLQYARVYQLIADFPHLEFEINGAISSPQEVHFHLSNNRGLRGTIRHAMLLSL